MTAITITQFQRLGVDANGDAIPIADGFVAGQTMTDAGTSNAMTDGARFVRIATDTSYYCNVYGTGTQVLLPAGSIDFFPVRDGQTIAFTTV